MVVLLLLCLLQPSDFHHRWVRFQGPQPPPAFHSLDATQAPRERLDQKTWEEELVGHKARLQAEGRLVVAELESGKKVWFEESSLEALSRHLLTEREQNGYWWNDLLDEFDRRGQLLDLEDVSPVEMRFQLSLTPDEVAEVYPQVLARNGLFVAEETRRDGLIQFQTGVVQEPTPGIFNPPIRRYRYLVTLTPSQVGCDLSLRATVTSWQRYPNSDFYGWQPDRSPGIRQRIRQSVAELLTRLNYRRDWLLKLEDWEAGFGLE